ncbi:MAG: hypothetical protein GOU99_02065 [Candidatus Altiarchaeota archaeon]|nr:hypothetical protein [Candidatus Altiarchaeota archaeon]
MDMRKLAKQMKTKQLEVTKVIFELKDKKLVFESPMVVEADMMGKKIYQVLGEPVEDTASNQDIQMIIEKTGCSENQAREAFKLKKDLAEAIVYIMEK